MPNVINRLLFSQLQEALKDRDSLLFLEVDKLTAEEAHSLRGELKAQGCTMHVVKNRIAAKALASNGFDDFSEHLKGQVAVVFGDEEGAAIKAAKIIEEAMKGRRKSERPVKPKAALLDGEVLSAEKALLLHTMPDKDAVRSMLLSAIQGPLRGLAMVINGPGSSLARVIQARCDEGDK